MKKNIVFLLISFFSFSVSALSYKGCDYSDISRMKSIVSNINLSYDYTIVDNEAYFDVTINNLTEDVYFYDTVTQKKYYYSDANNGEITILNYKRYSGSYKFYSAKNECLDVSLGSKYYSFPVYNRYYNDPLCKDIPNYSLCQKWGYINYSYDEFEEMVLDYKESKTIDEDEKINVEYKKTFLEKVIDIYINYYYYFLGGLILGCCIILIINNNNNKKIKL